MASQKQWLLTDNTTGKIWEPKVQLEDKTGNSKYKNSNSGLWKIVEVLFLRTSTLASHKLRVSLKVKICFRQKLLQFKACLNFFPILWPMHWNKLIRTSMRKNSGLPQLKPVSFATSEKILAFSSQKKRRAFIPSRQRGLSYSDRKVELSFAKRSSGAIYSPFQVLQNQSYFEDEDKLVPYWERQSCL